MKKNIRLLVFFVFLIISTKINAVENNSYTEGDIVAYNNIKFFVLHDSDSNSDSVDLLKFTPLTPEEINRYTENKAYLYINSNNSILEYGLSDTSKEYGTMAYYYSESCYKGGSTASCINDYESSNVKKVVDAWVKDKITTDNTISNYNARLLTLDDVMKSTYTPGEYDYYGNIKNWILSTSNADWFMETFRSSSIYYMFHNYNNYEGIGSKSVVYLGTVRPVITLKKNLISKVRFNEYHNNQVREYKIGDIINYNDTQFYVIKNSSEEDTTVTLLKNNPLTKYELEKYGDGYINNYMYDYVNNNYGRILTEPGKVIMNGNYAEVAYLSSQTCYRNNNTSDNSGCNTNYETSNVKHIVDNWLINSIDVNDIVRNNSGYEARLINSDDLIDLGYIGINASTTGNENFKPGEDTPLFMFDKNTNNMLTMIQSFKYQNNEGYYQYNIAIAADGYSFVARWIPNNAIGTVRPVVTLNKKEITPKITNVEEIEDTVSSDNDSNNKEVTIETEVDNDNVEIDTANNIKNSLGVLVPNTLSNKRLLLIIVGIVISIISSLIFIYTKNKK